LREEEFEAAAFYEEHANVAIMIDESTIVAEFEGAHPCMWLRVIAAFPAAQDGFFWVAGAGCYERGA